MPLREELREQGEFLFRHRSYLPLLWIILYVLALRESEWMEVLWGDRVDDFYDWFCVGVTAMGLTLRFYVAGTVPGRTSGRNTRKGQVADELNTTGAYSVVRHPLYVANFFIFMGFCLVPALWWFAALAVVAFWLYYERIAFAEEEFLREKFGRKYCAWASSTPAFAPDFALYRPARLAFSWRAALKREYLTFTTVASLTSALDYVEDALGIGLDGVEWEAETSAFTAMVLVICLLVRILRKHTRLLHVAGR